MIQKPKDYESAQAFDGEYETIPVGAHVCRIVGARVERTQTGLDMLALQIDIAEGSKLDGFYKRRFESAKKFKPDAKWSGTYRTVIADKDGNTKGMFKGLITCVEDSNSGFKFNWDERTLVTKSVGFNFGEEEYEASDGTIKAIVKPRFPMKVEKVRSGDYTLLERKKLDITQGHTNVGGYGFTNIPAPGDADVPPIEDDLPFD